MKSVSTILECNSILKIFSLTLSLSGLVFILFGKLSFLPKPKIDSSLLFFTPKEDYLLKKKVENLTFLKSMDPQLFNAASDVSIEQKFAEIFDIKVY